MSKIQTIQKVRKLVAEADLKQALEVLVQFLEKERGQFEDLTDSVIQLQSQYNKIKIDEVKGIISANDAQLRYNQLNQKILDLLEVLNSGKTLKSRNKTNSLKRILPFALVILIAGAVLGVIFVNKKNTPPINDTAFSCPKFEPDSAFKILLLPFRPLAGGLQNTHLAIQERFGDLRTQWKINTDTEVLEIDVKDNKIYPGDYDDASKLGKNCIAQLIIWGTTELPSSGDIITRTKFKFLESGDRFSFKRLNIKEGSQIDTVTSLSLIAAQGIITEKLENSMRLIFGLVAHEMSQNEAAIELLGDMENVVEDTALLIQQMALADSYLSTNRSEEALDSYNKVLEVHPNYGLALNNRGMLFLQKEAYAEATEDFSRNLSLDSSKVDGDVLVARGEAFFKSNHLRKAKEDLSKASELKPDDPVIREKLEQVNEKIEEQQVIKKRAERLQQARRSPSLDNQVKIATSSQQLGEYDQAILESERILARSPDNAQAYAVLMESYTAKGDTARTKQIWERARRSGVDLRSIQKWTSLSNAVIREKPTRTIQRRQ